MFCELSDSRSGIFAEDEKTAVTIISLEDQ
jgi:hypothetical protein